MANALYAAEWQSAEPAGTNIGPNCLNFWTDDANADALALAFATAMDAFVSGDLMSVTKQIDQYSPAGEDVGIVTTQDAILFSASASEHARFMSVDGASSVVGALAANYKPGGVTPGELLLFRDLSAVIDIRYVSH